MNRECPVCRTTFTTRRSHQIYCGSACRHTATGNRERDARRAAHDVHFVAVDGEGITRPDGTHDYVLLSVGDQSLHHNGERLHFDDICAFLYEQFEAHHSNAAFVGFFLGYDFTQWVRDLPQERAYYAFHRDGIAARQPRTRRRHPFPVTWGNWEFDFLGLKRMRLRPATPYGVVNTRRWMTICDAGPFFQSSFLTVINPDNTGDHPVCTPTEYSLIREGKQRRADAAFDHDMIRYNLLENEILSRVMTQLNTGFLAMGVRLSRDQWFGPGQAVQGWLDTIHAPTHEDFEAHVPRETWDAITASYYGGWFEIFAHGHIPDTTHEYDINSAYPHAISTLPCLTHGQWDHNTPLRQPHSITLCHATVRSHTPLLGAAPWRAPDGTIVRPRTTTGWYWQHELDAMTWCTYTTQDTWTFTPLCDCPPPLAPIATLYQQRLAIGKNTPHGKAMKLVYNSAYGKFAQSIGHPRYANALYASLITSHTRTAIARAIATHPHPDSVVMVATDGVYFTHPHPTLTIDPHRLGAWDHTEKHHLTLLMPGVYWDDNARRTDRVTLKSRGINAAALAASITQLDHDWNTWNPTLAWPHARIPLTFQCLTPAAAITQNNWHLVGHVTTDGHRDLYATPHLKRHPTAYRHPDGYWYTHAWTWYDLQPYHMNATNESTPYAQRFGNTPPDTLTEGGTITTDLADLLMKGLE